MFLHLSVILLTRRGGVQPPGIGRHLPQADPSPRQTPLQADIPLGRHFPPGILLECILVLDKLWSISKKFKF